MRKLRPLTPGEKTALVTAFFFVFAAIVRVTLRNWSAPDGWAEDLGLTAIALSLLGGVAYGLKSGFLGGSK